MHVLHLPLNIASQASITVRALRDLGIEAKGVISGSAAVQNSAGLFVRPSILRRRHPVQWTITEIRYLWMVLREVVRADIVHWHFGAPALPRALDLKWAQWLSKPGIVEFWGSDIRVPEEEKKVNPYYASAWETGYEYKHVESREGSYRRQELFVRHGITACLLLDSFRHYLKPGLWQKVYSSRGRVVVSEFQPMYPSVHNRYPVLAHSPTAKVGKGTAAVEQAVQTLQGKYPFEFKLIHGVSYAEAQRIKQTCDVFLDQFVDGGGYGLSAVEAFAMGKPVVCYVRPSAVPFLPEGCPVINANQDNLADVLQPLLQDGRLRHDLGRRGRAFAEAYHDAHEYARRLVGIYQELIDQKRLHG